MLTIILRTNFSNQSHSPCYTQYLIFITMLVLIVSVEAAAHKPKSLQDLSVLTLNHENNTWIVDLNAAHKNLKLAPKIESCRSWIKSSQCKVCDENGQNCQTNRSCFSSDKEPKLSCDSSYCQKGAEYSDKTRSIFGFQAQIFGKLQKNEQTLIPLIFANKISETFAQSGQYCLLDSESAFNQGLIVLKNKNIEVINTKVNTQEAKNIKDGVFQTHEMQLSLDGVFDGFTANSAVITNSEPLAYKDISQQAAQDFKVRLSLNQLGITVPLKMFNQLSAGISSVYFPTNKCRINAGKIKCFEQLNFGGFTEAMLQLRLKQNLVLSLPIHMLISSCAMKACQFLLDSHEEDSVIVGSVFLQALSLEWNLDSHKMWVHRLNNQWADPYRVYRIDNNKRGFLSNMFTLLFHIFLFMLYCILGLAAISLFLNFLMRWREVWGYLKGIAKRVSSGKKQSLNSVEEEQYFVSEIVSQPASRRRKINRLQQTIDDDI